MTLPAGAQPLPEVKLLEVLDGKEEGLVHRDELVPAEVELDRRVGQLPVLGDAVLKEAASLNKKHLKCHGWALSVFFHFFK